MAITTARHIVTRWLPIGSVGSVSNAFAIRSPLQRHFFWGKHNQRSGDWRARAVLSPSVQCFPPGR